MNSLFCDSMLTESDYDDLWIIDELLDQSAGAVCPEGGPSTLSSRNNAYPPVNR